MKKILLLLLAMVGMVSTASATDYTIYFKPDANWTQADAWFVVCQKNSDDNDISFHQLNAVQDCPGYYSATFTLNANCAYLKFMRKNPTNSTYNNWDDVWNGVKAPNPTTTTLYENKPDANNNNDWSCWNSYDGITVTEPSDMTFTINNFGCEADILPNFMDANSSENNNLTSNDDFTYSRTVSGNVVRKGTYGFKLSDGTNTYDNSGSAWAVSGISTTNDAEYNITYSYNFITGVASATATDTEESVSLSEKYFLAGDETLTGHNWDWTGATNEMAIDGGGTTASVTLNDVLIQGTYYYKVAKLLLNNGTKYKTFKESGDNNNYYFEHKRYYDITFSCDLSTLEGSASASNSRGYYLFGGTGGWDWGQKMTETSTGVYSATLSGKQGYAFCIADTNDDNNLDEGHPKWTTAIRPNKDTETRTYIGFANYSGTTVSENTERGWQIQGTGSSDYDNDADVTITYTPASNAWAVTCADMVVSISGAGYATYSNYYPYQVSGATNLYTVSALGENSVTLTSHNSDTKFYGGAAILIKGTTQATIKALADGTSTDAIGDNYLVPSNNTSLSVTSTAEDGKYVFSWDGSTPSTVGFYKAKAETGTLAAHKAYLDLNGAGAREFLGFSFDNEATGISEVSNKRNDGIIYNLQGQRNNLLKKGINIVNGKKVFVK